MSGRVVVDASVVVKWFLPENGTAAALRVRDELRAGRTMAWGPELLHLELGNAVWKLVTARVMTPADATAILRTALSLPFQWVPMMRLADAALTVAMETGCSVYDAAYVALAGQVDATLVTADGRLARRLAGTVYQDRLTLIV